MKTVAFFLLFFVFFLGCKQKKNEYSTELVEVLDFSNDAVYDTVNVPSHLKKWVKNVSALNIHQNGVLAKGEGKQDNFENFIELKEIASEKELVLLTNNKNKAVSVYSAIALAEKNPQYLENLFHTFLNRNETVHIQNGCIFGDQKIAEPLYWSYLSSVKNTKSDEILQKLDTQIIFHSNSTYDLLRQALENRIYSGAYKKQIEDLAFRDHKIPAILYLTDHHKKEYSDKLQKEYSRILENEELYNGEKQRYLVKFLSFNNPDNRDVILNYLKKDTIFHDQHEILSQLKNNGISQNEIPLRLKDLQ